MLTLGIDYGTTKNAVLLYDSANPGNTLVFSEAHHSGCRSSVPGAMEQDFEKVYRSIIKLIQMIPPEKRQKLSAIGLTGQMHSTLLFSLTGGRISPVITWQDKRASLSGTLSTYCRKTGLPLADGFGAVTLAELNRTGVLSRYDAAVNPVSEIARRLTGCRTLPVMDPTFAASWGIWKLDEAYWDLHAARKLGIPEKFLPSTVPAGSIIGKTRDFPGLPDGIPVTAPLGDNQASVYACSEHPEDEIYLTVGTGSQLSVILAPDAGTDSTSVELRPFPGGRLLAVNAPLCGGKAWAFLGKTVNNFLESLGFAALPEAEMLTKLDHLAANCSSGSSLKIRPSFLGSRQDPELRGEISGITLDNFTLPELAQSMAVGIIRELKENFPADWLKNRKTAVCSGNGIRKCQAIRNAISREFGLPLQLSVLQEEAAAGAAMLACDAVQS